MSGFANIGELVDAYNGGARSDCSFRKVPSQASTAGWWVDLSMASGNPVPQYYAASPLEAAKLLPMKGIFHGDSRSPAEKFIVTMGITTPTAALVGRYMLLDYLLYYPFIDGDSTDQQDLTNTEVLDRYETGAGVRVMAVSVAPSTGGGSFFFSYTNQDGVAGRTSPTITCTTTSAPIASLVIGQPAVVNTPGPFLPLASGDSGVRSIEAVTFIVPNGGLVALVLVKPIADLAIREINTTCERNWPVHGFTIPAIEDGAYLGLILNCAGSVAAGQLSGYATFVWK